MPVITFSKEFASGGVELAQKLAGQLGCQLAGKAVLAQLAERLEMSEAEVELLHRGRELPWFKLVDEVFLHTVRKISQKPDAALDDKRYLEAIVHLIFDLAKQDDLVILGWGAQYILAGHPQAQHFRVVAPLEARGQRLAAKSGVSVEQAVAECKRQDAHSQGFVEHYFDKHWGDPHAYKLVLNTGAMAFDLDQALGIIKAAL